MSGLRFCLVAGSLASTLVTGCHSGGPSQKEMPPPTVTVALPVQKAIADYREFTGRIDAVETVEIRARVKGFITEILFKDGQEVKAGDQLYVIDPREYQAAVAQAQADVKRQQSQVRLTAQEMQRGEELRSSNAISIEEYQQRVSAHESAKAALEQARAALDSAKLQLSFTKIYAPIPGRVGRTLVTQGNLVGQSEPTLLTTVVRMDPVYVYFEAPERDYLDYQKLIREQGAPAAGQATVPLEVGLANEEDYPHKGVLEFRNNVIEQGTGTIQLRGQLPNPDRLLTPGLFARVRVPFGGPKPRLLVPDVALQADQRGTFVLVVKPDNTVEARHVKTGPTSDGEVVVLSGLQPTDRVVVNGLQRARPGSKVQPQMAK